MLGHLITHDVSMFRVKRGEIGLIIEGHDSSEHLSPVFHNNLIQMILKYAGIDSKLSQAGLITERIIEKLGDVDGGRIFRIRGVRQLIEGLNSEACVSRAHAKKQIWNNEQFKEYERLFIEPRVNAKLSNDDVFNFLLKHDFFRAGLELVCENCKLKNWLSLKDIEDYWFCQYCGHKNQTSVHLENRGDWKFRKSGLFAKDNNQEGAIPVILTIGQILHTVHEPNLIYSTSLKLQVDSNDVEIDFAVLNLIRDGQFEFGLGECKSAGGEIDENDIGNLLIVRDKLLTSDIECYLIFSKTSDAFTDKELGLFRELISNQVPVVLFTNHLLEPMHPFWEIQNIPHKHANCLSDMVQNSIAIYLNEDNS